MGGGRLLNEQHMPKQEAQDSITFSVHVVRISYTMVFELKNDKR